MEVGYEVEQSNKLGEKSLVSVSWSGLKFGDEAEAFDLGSVASASVQLSGSFGEGGSVALEGSNNGEYFIPLKDVYGSLLVRNKPSIDSLGQHVRFVRPAVKSGDELTDVKCTLYINRRA
jgi:hypothetical protein